MRRAGVLALALLLGACAPQEPEEGEIRIGLLALMDSAFRNNSGIPSVRGAELAAKRVNEAGGVWIAGRRHRIEIVVQPYDPRPDAATAAARALINRVGVHAIVGPQLSAHAIPVAGVAEAAAIPMISPMSSNPATTAGKIWVFRLAFLDDFQGDALGRFASEELGAATAAVLFEKSTTYSADLARRFRERFEALGGRVVAWEGYEDLQRTTFGAEVERIRAAGPDVLFLPNRPAHVVLQVREVRRAGVGARLLGGDTWDLGVLTAEPGAQGAFVSHQWHYEASTPGITAFLDAYREEYAGSPRATAALTYDAVAIIANAASGATELTPDALRRGIAATREFRGASGTITFQGSGDPARSVVVSSIVGGGSRIHMVLDPR